MIKQTNEEIKDYLETLFPDANKIVITRNGSGWNIEMSRMYEYLNLPLMRLIDLSEFFGSKNINDSRYSFGGCETCDYGSSYTIELTVLPEEES